LIEPIVNEDDRSREIHRWLAKLKDSPVPPQLHDGLAHYLGAGVPPGSFLTALLSSNLSVAIVRADLDCRKAMGDIVLWLYAFAPAASWGSGENVSTWRASFAQKVSA
jgi:hypothetical protein